MDELNRTTVDNILFSKIAPSAIHGLGLFAIKKILKNSILGILDGQYLPWEKKYSEDFEWNAITQHLILVRPYRTKYSYINHSRTPNLKLMYNPLRVVAIYDIEVGCELTLDYREEPLSEEYLNGHGATYL